VLYVDRDCCEVSGNSGSGKYNNLFHEWPNLQVRLNSMHYMARFSSLLTHPSHPLYAVFKRRLRDCIFTRDEGDMRSLLDSKKNELLSNGTRVESLPSQRQLLAMVPGSDIQKFVRRRIRPAPDIDRLISNLLLQFSDPLVTDGFGTPLLREDAYRYYREELSKHCQCLQDPENVPLYRPTGTVTRHGVELVGQLTVETLPLFEGH
ncbi:hypothetical protein FOL47_003818, partial [Perkinsus chesapeaki]